MKKFMIIVVAVLAVVYFYPLIGSGNMDIETVKNSNIPTSPLVGAFLTGLPTEQSATIGYGISKITGVDGTAEWETYHPNKYKDNQNIRCIQVTINKTSVKGKKQTANFQFLLNKSSKYVELGYFEVNGKPKNKLEAIMALQYGIMDESYQNTSARNSVARLAQKISPAEIRYLKKFCGDGADYPDERYFEILKSRLGKEMRTSYKVLRDNISVHSARVKGNELIIEGNAPHQGGDEAGIIVINLDDGSTSVGLLHAKKTTIFANNQGIVPQIVNDWASEKDVGD